MTVDVRALLPREELGRRQGVGTGEAKGEGVVPASGKLGRRSDSSLHAPQTWFMPPAPRQLQAGGRRADRAGWEGSAESWRRWSRLRDCGETHSAPWTAIPRGRADTLNLSARRTAVRPRRCICGRDSWPGLDVPGLEAKLHLWDPGLTETPNRADIEGRKERRQEGRKEKKKGRKGGRGEKKRKINPTHRDFFAGNYLLPSSQLQQSFKKVGVYLWKFSVLPPCLLLISNKHILKIYTFILESDIKGFVYFCF